MTVQTNEDFRLLRLLLDLDPNPQGGVTLLELAEDLIHTEADRMELLEWLERKGVKDPDTIWAKMISIANKGMDPELVMDD